MSLRRHNNRRGLMAEINVVPYIDVNHASVPPTVQHRTSSTAATVAIVFFLIFIL